jgi:hypothetical protein
MGSMFYAWCGRLVLHALWWWDRVIDGKTFSSIFLNVSGVWVPFTKLGRMDFGATAVHNVQNRPDTDFPQ